MKFTKRRSLAVKRVNARHHSLGCAITGRGNVAMEQICLFRPHSAGLHSCLNSMHFEQLPVQFMQWLIIQRAKYLTEILF